MYMIFAENYAGDIVQAITWTKDKADGIRYMKTLLSERKKTATRIWAERINQTETA